MKINSAVIVFFISVILGTFLYPREEIKTISQKAKKTVKDSVVTVKITAAGDAMCHSTQFNYAYVKKDSFNFKPVFDSIKDYFDSSDFVAVNLETVIASSDSDYSGYPVFNTPQDFLDGLRYAGIKHLILANNHILDRGLNGLLGTIEKVKEAGFSFSGAVERPEQIDSVKIFNLKGIKVAFLPFTYFTNNRNPQARKYVDIIRQSRVKRQIALARKAGADFVIVYFHFGEEYERLPNAMQKKIVKRAVEAGADLILASHTHTVQPVEFVKKANGDSVFVIYSMGNFISNQRWRYSDGGVAISVELCRNFTKDSLFVKEYSYLPFWVFKGKIKGKKRYLVYPLSLKKLGSLPSFFTKEDSLKARQSFFDTDSILGAFGVKLKRDL